MKERRPEGINTNRPTSINYSEEVINAAISDYQELLRTNGVHEVDILKITDHIPLNPNSDIVKLVENIKPTKKT